MTVETSLRENWSPPPVHLNVISSRGGLGDMIARLPAIKYLVDAHPHISVTVYWPDYFIPLAVYLVPPATRLTHKPLSTAPFAMPKPYVEFDNNRITSLNLHLTKHAFLMLMDMDPPNVEAMRYPSAPRVDLDSDEHPFSGELLYQLYEEPFVVVTTGYTSKTRQWPAVHVNTLGRELRSKGLTPVLLGSTQTIVTGDRHNIEAKIDDGIDRSLFLDLTNTTTLIEALGIMQRAKAVVGVDNGLLHLAHCTDVPVVYGLTSLLPEHRIPFRTPQVHPQDPFYAIPNEQGLTEVLEAQVPCNGCQSRGFAINTDWRTCLFSDYACTLTLTAGRYLEKLVLLGIITK